MGVSMNGKLLFETTEPESDIVHHVRGFPKRLCSGDC
jgi:hypothetical protein